MVHSDEGKAQIHVNEELQRIFPGSQLRKSIHVFYAMRFAYSAMHIPFACLASSWFKYEKRISIFIPVYNEEAGLEHFFSDLCAVTSKLSGYQ